MSGRKNEVRVVVTPHLWDAAARSADDVGEPAYCALERGQSLVVARVPQPGDLGMPNVDGRVVIHPSDLGGFRMDEFPQAALVVEPTGLLDAAPIRVRVTSAPSHRQLWRLSVHHLFEAGFERATSQGVPLLLEHPAPVELQYRPHRAATWTTLVEVDLFWDYVPTPKRRGVPTSIGSDEAKAAEIERRLRAYFEAGAACREYFSCAMAVMAVAGTSDGLEKVVAEALHQVGWKPKAKRCTTWSGGRAVNTLQKIAAPREYRDEAPELDVGAYLKTSLPGLGALPRLEADRRVETTRVIAEFLGRHRILPKDLLDAARRGFDGEVTS